MRRPVRAATPGAAAALLLSACFLSSAAQASPDASWQAAVTPLTTLSGQQTSTAAMKPGDQANVVALDGELPFAGQNISAENLTAVFGMSSDVAYVMVLDGQARANDATAKPGRMLVIPAIGDDVEVARFDADRFRDSLSAQLDRMDPALLRHLDTVARRQARGKWWGRYASTGRNLNAARGIELEQDRRALLSNPTMQQLRFAGLEDSDAVARKTAESFVAALERRDREAVAALLDPTQFGDLGLRGGAAAARSVVADRLLSEVTVASTALVAGAKPLTWQFDSAFGTRTIELQQVDDLFFVSAVR